MCRCVFVFADVQQQSEHVWETQITLASNLFILPSVCVCGPLFGMFKDWAHSDVCPMLTHFLVSMVTVGQWPGAAQRSQTHKDNPPHTLAATGPTSMTLSLVRSLYLSSSTVSLTFSISFTSILYIFLCSCSVALSLSGMFFPVDF